MQRYTRELANRLREQREVEKSFPGKELEEKANREELESIDAAVPLDKTEEIRQEQYRVKGDLEYGIGNDEESLYYYRRDLENKQSQYGERSVEVSDTHFRLGETRYRLGDRSISQSSIQKNHFEWAVRHLNRADQLRLHVYGSKNHADIVDAYKSLGQVHADLEERKQALRCCEKVLQIESSMRREDSLHLTGVYRDLERIYRKQNRLEEASSCHDRALQITSNFDVTDGEKAREPSASYQEELQIESTVEREEIPHLTALYRDLKQKYEENRMLKKASDCCIRALQIKKDFLDYTESAFAKEDPLHLANSYKNLMQEYQENNMAKEASDCYNQVLQIKQELIDSLNIQEKEKILRQTIKEKCLISSKDRSKMLGVEVDVGDCPKITARLLDALESPCPFSPERGSVSDTHLLVWVPSHVNRRPLTLSYFAEILGRLSDRPGVRIEFPKEYDYEREQKSTSCWVLMCEHTTNRGSNASSLGAIISIVMCHLKGGTRFSSREFVIGNHWFTDPYRGTENSWDDRGLDWVCKASSGNISFVLRYNKRTEPQLREAHPFEHISLRTF